MFKPDISHVFTLEILKTFGGHTYFFELPKMISIVSLGTLTKAFNEYKESSFTDIDDKIVPDKNFLPLTQSLLKV